MAAKQTKYFIYKVPDNPPNYKNVTQTALGFELLADEVLLIYIYIIYTYICV